MASHTMLKITCLVFITAVVLAPATAQTIACGTVTSTLAPCFVYILAGGTVATNCCAGVRSLYNSANTTPKRRAVCSCLKSITRTASPTAVNNAKSLPGKCGLSIPYQISPSIDCNTVK